MTRLFFCAYIYIYIRRRPPRIPQRKITKNIRSCYIYIYIRRIPWRIPIMRPSWAPRGLPGGGPRLRGFRVYPGVYRRIAPRIPRNPHIQWWRYGLHFCSMRLCFSPARAGGHMGSRRLSPSATVWPQSAQRLASKASRPGTGALIRFRAAYTSRVYLCHRQVFSKRFTHVACYS